jgi:hypothetical protein
VRYAEAHPELTSWEITRAIKKEHYMGGVKLNAKDLRDVFGTVVMDNVSERDTVRRLIETCEPADHYALHETRQRSHAGSGQKPGGKSCGKLLAKRTLKRLFK